MTEPQDINSPTHIAYSDESNYNTGRYRSVGLVTLKEADYKPFSQEIQKMLVASNVAEFKWKGLAGAKQRFASIKLIDFILNKVVDGLIRVDVLVWDTKDSRHKLMGRDDIANLHRMYYHLLRDVLKKRWPDDTTWKLCPDEHTAMQWDNLKFFLEIASVGGGVDPEGLIEGKLILQFKRFFGVTEIAPCKSHEEPLTQLADLFALVMR